MSDFGECPACISDLKIEKDSRMASGFAVVCDCPDCPDGGGAWPATEKQVRDHLQASTFLEK